LVHKGTIRPVDWESAAVAAGEIDLATILHWWKPDVVATCIAAYSYARWPEGPPAGFESRLAAARIYRGLRWLGEHPHNTLGEYRKFFHALFEDARQLELI
jgi:thiamine kinase-like enzyme